MDDLISRQVAIAYAISGRTREIDGENWIRVSEVRENIKAISSAQPERRGHWIGIDEYPYESWECDKCGDIESGDDISERMHYCPNCGARMEE